MERSKSRQRSPGIRICWAVGRGWEWKGELVRGGKWQFESQSEHQVCERDEGRFRKSERERECEWEGKLAGLERKERGNQKAVE